MKHLKRLLIFTTLLIQVILLVTLFIPSLLILWTGWNPTQYQVELITKTYDKLPK